MVLRKIIYLLITFLSMQANAQLTVKTEYFGESSYWQDKGEAPRERIGTTKGSAIVYSASLNIPLSMRLDENEKPVVWGVGIAGSYASLKNKNFTEELVIPEIGNLSAALYHMRPINDRWSMIMSVGAGVYAPTGLLKNIRAKHVLGSMSAIFIYEMTPNLDLGAGLAINSTFGYPMAFPALYVNWRMQGNIDFKLALTNGLEVKAGLNMHKNLSLSVVGEMNGQTALLKKDEKDVIFTHQYIIAALQPEIKINKNIHIPIRLGINGIRSAYFSDRTLKAMFQNKNNYYFQVSPYASAGITVNL
ncbi:DUF6268 family outer membrane beta-barrel protein [Sphingobacterium sp. UT-1RO-CII-1]|uniref:DUF6268 family outer membrane beta-barrel protein n=1 Tax=Sphingobacterium sp. UT-1RO-CII-1 TaxID=2995225 RepID=UPI00227A227D|nr:DUF6268 family outer membrane beta-barrel protein [Sphingobacterium sp. UT-1RO-CII-1]MCY4778786.1 DUF6268 family outer membrane beta-barrel protein [Sphingobacterium sp. UT-1RO-CII-1]